MQEENKNNSQTFFTKIKSFIGKDSGIKNESKKTIVVMRLLSISILLYMMMPPVFMNLWKTKTGVWTYIIIFAALFDVFASSYYHKTIFVLVKFNVLILAMIVAFIHFLGWNMGVQHFLFILVILEFFAVYNKYALKVGYTIALCFLRIELFFIFLGKESVVALTKSENEIMQILTSITIYWCLAAMCYIYGRDSQKMEAKLIQYNEQLRIQANTDKLTGLYNRRKGMEKLETIMESKKNAAENATPMSLCICDIDFFKKVNDTYGHDFGDEVLKGVSKILKEEMKDDNFVARWGGEEFLLVFPNMNGEHAYTVTEIIRSKIKRMSIPYEDTEVKVTMTFGLSEYGFSETITELLKHADQKLYHGKESGRDRVVY